jgi:hypothetical protein
LSGPADFIGDSLKQAKPDLQRGGFQLREGNIHPYVLSVALN